MNIAELTRFKIMLLAHREELLELEQSVQQSIQPVQPDEITSGRPDAIQSQQMTQEILRRRTQDIARIDAALQRIANGSYGRCVQCAEEIDQRRLEINPSATHCDQCV